LLQIVIFVKLVGGRETRYEFDLPAGTGLENAGWYATIVNSNPREIHRMINWFFIFLCNAECLLNVSVQRVLEGITNVSYKIVGIAVKVMIITGQLCEHFFNAQFEFKKPQYYLRLYHEVV
jgi:hypothetical protein